MEQDQDLVFLVTAPEVIDAHTVLTHEIAQNPNNTVARRLQKDLPSEVTARTSESPEGYLPSFCNGTACRPRTRKSCNWVKRKTYLMASRFTNRAIRAARALAEVLHVEVEDYAPHPKTLQPASVKIAEAS